MIKILSLKWEFGVISYCGIYTDHLKLLKLGVSTEALARLLLAKDGSLQFDVKVVGIDARP